MCKLLLWSRAVLVLYIAWLFSALSGKYIEIAYWTISGAVQVILQHPELVMQGPQLFQTFTVHTSCITKVMLSAKHLVGPKKYISCENIQIYLEKLYFMMVTMSRLWHDFQWAINHIYSDIHSYIKYTSKSLVFFSSNPNWSIDYDHISFLLIRHGLSVSGAWIMEIESL